MTPLRRPLMLIADLDLPGGTQHQCLCLCEELQKRGVATRILTRGRRLLPARGSVNGVEVERTRAWLPRLIDFLRATSRAAAIRTGPEWSVGNPPPAARRLPLAGRAISVISHDLPTRILERELEQRICARTRDFEVLHVHGTFWAALVLAASRSARRLGKPWIVKITNEEKRTWRDLESSPRVLEALRGADAIVVVNESTRRFLRARMPGCRIEYVPNGVQVTETLPPGGGRTVLFVGWLKEQKGVDVLLRAWALLTVPPGVRLVLAGDGPQRTDLESLARNLRLESVDFLGFREDVAPLWKGAGVFVLPSRWEGMPNALREAMAQGLPCIATRIPGSEDAIRDGEEGLLVPPEDHAALAGALGSLLGNEGLRLRLGAAARRRVERDFSLASVAESYIQMYASL